MFWPPLERTFRARAKRLEVFVSKPAATLAVCCAIAAIALRSLADTSHLRVGDKLTYAVSVESQQQVGTARHPGPLSSRAGTGTETLEITSVDSDGTARGSLTLDLTGYDGNKQLAIHKTVPAIVTPDGRIVAVLNVDPWLDQTSAIANESIKDLAARDLANAASWQWTMAAPRAAVSYTFNRQSRGQVMLQGLPTFAIETIGGIDPNSVDDPTKTQVEVAGTFYYDQRDRLFIGEAVRSECSIFDSVAGLTQDSSALVTIALRDFARAPEPAPSVSPAPEVEASPTPTAVPTEYSPIAVPTVTPSTT